MTRIAQPIQKRNGAKHNTKKILNKWLCNIGYCTPGEESRILAAFSLKLWHGWQVPTDRRHFQPRRFMRFYSRIGGKAGLAEL